MRSWLWLVWILVPVMAVVQLQKHPVLKRHVLAYAERQSGESGFLWFDEEVGANATQWSKMLQIDGVWLSCQHFDGLLSCENGICNVACAACL